MNFDTVFRQYLETALWSSTDNADDSGGEPLDNNYSPSDISEGSRKLAEDQVLEFLNQLSPDCARYLAECQDDSSVGHDLWLTRNGHGAGFWDVDYAEPYATELTNLAHKLGEVTLYVGEDNRLYFDRY